MIAPVSGQSADFSINSGLSDKTTLISGSTSRNHSPDVAEVLLC
jgi:hypothetical protein